ncbi:hypothetical protein Ciccas_010906 [Cichlidogyrus casuarinus]|uniref:Uncharacterized protein n=1 Tax=Cichlidogyrus casuarinus TaxID=1844966 RepID=A0ABD2PSS4_9PLAT
MWIPPQHRPPHQMRPYETPSQQMMTHSQHQPPATMLSQPMAGPQSAYRPPVPMASQPWAASQQLMAPRILRPHGTASQPITASQPEQRPPVTMASQLLRANKQAPVTMAASPPMRSEMTERQPMRPEVLAMAEESFHPSAAAASTPVRNAPMITISDSSEDEADLVQDSGSGVVQESGSGVVQESEEVVDDSVDEDLREMDVTRDLSDSELSKMDELMHQSVDRLVRKSLALHLIPNTALDEEPEEDDGVVANSQLAMSYQESDQ